MLGPLLSATELFLPEPSYLPDLLTTRFVLQSVWPCADVTLKAGLGWLQGGYGGENMDRKVGEEKPGEAETPVKIKTGPGWCGSVD